MDLQCVPVNFCTNFPLKVKYSDFHKIYINISKENLDIYKKIIRPSPIAVYIMYLGLPVRSIFQICTWLISFSTIRDQNH
jgi:hypothetical protein